MPEPRHGYRIDYDAPDVVDLMRQIRTRAAGETGAEPTLPGAATEPRARLRDWIELDDRRPWRIQEELGLGGSWNVSPEDLRASHPGPVGTLIGGIRAALRPVTKLLVNLDLPLYKQFKVNLGVASALRDLADDNDTLRRRVAALERRLEKLEAGAGSSTSGNEDERH